MENRIVNYPILAAIKIGGRFTDEERGMLRKQAWSKSIDNATRTHVATDCFGNELALFFDVYVVENLSLLKRLRHSFRMFKTAVARKVHVQPRIIIITLK